MNLKHVMYLVLIVFAYFAYDNYKIGQYKPDYNSTIENAPLQKETYRSEIYTKDFIITPLKDYKIQARVLSKKKYTSGEESKLSNFDLALGWNEMSEMENLERIEITQSNRWYYWKVKEFFIPRESIEHNSSNHHIIHGNDKVYDILKGIQKYQIIEMKGYLVKVENKEKEKIVWKSSLTRTDTGDGACEVFYVEDIKIIQ